MSPGCSGAVQVSLRAYRRRVRDTTRQVRTANGTFDAQLDDEQLLHVIAEVAQAAAPTDPASVSQRPWDRALARSRYADLAPSARGCVMRLNRRGGALSWREVVEMALRPPASQRQSLAAAMRTAEQDHLDKRLVFYAVRKVAREEGTHPTTPTAYDRGRDRLLRRASRRHRHGADERARLPTANQLVEWAERTNSTDPRPPWHLVLEAVGLPVPQHGKGTPENGAGPRGVDAAVALAEFARANGRWASKQTLTAFCRDGGVALSRADDKPWPDRIAEASAILEQTGDPIPTEMPRPTGRGNKVTYVLPEGGLPAALAAHQPSTQPPLTVVPARSKWSPDRVVDKLAEFDRLVPRSEGRSQGVYRRHLPDHPDWPGVSIVIRRGGWSKLMNEAKQRRSHDRRQDA